MGDAPHCMDRVVSLAPSATSTIHAIGAESVLVAATHHGDHRVERIGGWLNPDIDRIEALQPDLVITTDSLQASIVAALRARNIETLHLTPTTLEEVIDSITEIGHAIGRDVATSELVSAIRDRLAQLETLTSEQRTPTVYCEEWSDPPMVAGNWIPDIVSVAGGAYPFASPGDRSKQIDRATVEAHAPTHIFLNICGMGTAVDPSTILDRGWSIPAIEENRVWVIDDRLLNQPAPRLVDGANQIAQRLYPDLSEIIASHALLSP